MRKIKIKFSEIICVLFILLSIFLYTQLLSAQIRNITLDSHAKVMAIKAGILQAKLNFDKGYLVYYSYDNNLPAEFEKEGFQLEIQEGIRGDAGLQDLYEIEKKFHESHNNKLLNLCKEGLANE